VDLCLKGFSLVFDLIMGFLLNFFLDYNYHSFCFQLEFYQF